MDGQRKGNAKGRCTQHETFFYSRFTTLNLKARLKRESLTPEESRQIESVYTEKTDNFKKTLSFRRLVSFLLAIVFVFTSLPMAGPEVVALTQPGEMEITKTAVPVSDSANNREYDITLSVKGSELITKAPVDVVLVLDTSGSMGYGIGNTTRLQMVKNAAKTFAASIIDDNNNARVAVVRYSGDRPIAYNHNFNDYDIVDTPYNDASTVISFSQNKSNINNSINALSANGGTNIEAGFYQAKQLLASNANPNAQKVVVLMTDGEPTFAYTQETEDGFHWGQIWYPGTGGLTYGHGDEYRDDYKNKAIAEAFRIKQDFNAKIYTVGFTASSEMTTNIRAVLDPTGTNKYQEQYFEATDANGIGSAFASISNRINAVAKNAKIVDIINEDFELVANTAGNATLYGQTLTWDIGDVYEEEESVTFRVRAKNNVYGAAYTNAAAYLYFDTPVENTFYNDSSYNNPNSNITNTKRLTFNKPVVKVPPVAANDDYYQVKVGTTLDATANAMSVLANDPSNKMQTVDGWTTTSVVAERITSPTKGTISAFNEDGTFTYVSDAGASGTDTFTYDIVTTVQQGDGAVITLRDTATVTITILPAFALTVIYEDKDSGTTLTPATDPNSGKAYAAGETYNVETPAIADYDYVSPKAGSSLTGTMPNNNHTVTLLYEKKTVSSTIVYYKDGQEIETVAGPSGKWGSSQILIDTQINKHLTEGYSVSGDPANYTLVLDKVSANNVYRIDYTVNKYPVTVEYYYKNDTTTPFATANLGNHNFGSEISSVNDASHTSGIFDRDVAASTALPFTVKTSGNVIKVIYVSKPVALDDNASTSANDAVTIDVLDNDSDPLNSTLSLTGIVTPPSNGVVSLVDGKYVYTPNTDFIGKDSFVYGIKNAYDKTATATVTITIKPWQSITVSYLEQGTSNYLKTTFRDSLRAGTALAGVTGLDIIQPDFVGFTKAGIENNLVIPSAMPENPLTITYLYTRNNYDYTVNYYYKNSGDLIESEEFSSPFESVITAVNDSTLVDLTKYDRYEVTGLPLTIGTNEAANVINVYYAAKPQANADSRTINPEEIIEIDVLSNDDDIDGKPGELKVKSITQPAAGRGSATLDSATGKITYTPADGLAGTVVTFQYTIEDAQGQTSTATVTITIRSYYNLTVKYVESDNVDNVIGGQDAVQKKYGDSYSIVAPLIVSGYEYDDTAVQNLSGTMPESDHEVVVYYRKANISYTVEYYYENSNDFITSSNFSALFESTVEASAIADYDSLPAGYTRFRVVFPNAADKLTITDNPQANIVKVYYAAKPVADDDAITINPNEEITIEVLKNDTDIDGYSELEITAIDTTTIAGFEGTATISADNKTITYKPVVDEENKTVSFKYTITDEQNQSSTATVTVTIRPFFTLTVYYRETGNDSVELANYTSQDKLVKGESYEASAKTIAGYAPTGVVESRPITNLGLTGQMPEGDLDIIVRYDKIQVGSTINYFRILNGEEQAWDTAYGPSATWGTEVKLTQEQIDMHLSGLKALQDDYYSPGAPDDYNLTLDMNPDNNVFKVVYKSAPRANNDVYEVDLLENITFDVTENDTDMDGDTLSVESIVEGSGPQFGTAVINDNGTITYTHTSQLDFGLDQFKYIMEDSDGNESTAIVYVYIHPYYPLNISLVDLDTGKLIDTENNPLALTMKRGTEHLLTGLNYPVPGFGYLGIVPTEDQQYAARSIMIMADDDSADERLIPEDLDIRTLLPQETITMREGGLSRYLVYQRENIGYTVEYYYARNSEEPFATWQGEALFESIVNSWPLPTNENVVYADPEATPIDLDDFAEAYTEGSPLTVSADPENNVIRVYYAAIPTAEDDNDTTPMNEPVTIDVLDNDSDPLGGDLIIVDVTDPENGNAEINEDGTITVTPDANFTGTITFEYTVRNQDEQTATATVTVTVTAPPTPTPTIPTIVVTETTLPLAEPTPTMPTINVTTESVPLAQPSTVPTINVEPQEIPQSGERAPIWPIGLALLLMAGGLAYILHHKGEEEKDQ